MTVSGEPNQTPRTARKAPRDDARPQSVLERQETISGYLLRRAKRRRELFLRRSATFSVRKELARSLFLVACLVVDALVVPEALFLLASPLSWVVTVAGIALAVWLEFRAYQHYFSLPPPLEPPP